MDGWKRWKESIGCQELERSSDGCCCLTGIQLQFCKEKVLRYNSVNILNTAGLRNGEDGKFHIMCILPQLKLLKKTGKSLGKINSPKTLFLIF